MPAVLGHVGVGAGHEQPPPGGVGQGRPHLLAVDHPLVAVAHRPGGEPGHVGPGPGLAEELAPDLLAGEEGPEVALPLLVGPVGEDGGRRHAVADDVAVRLVGRADRRAARARRGPGDRGSPRGPRSPTGNDTQARPASKRAPRNSTAGVEAGSCCASRSRSRERTRSSSVVTASVRGMRQR